MLDRSIYEDLYFTKINKELGRISELEFEVYEGLLNNMMEELDELPKKSPDLLIYLKSSFETVLKMRRLFINNYNYSEVLILDMDNMDIVNNVEDRTEMIRLVEQKLNEIRK